MFSQLPNTLCRSHRLSSLVLEVMSSLLCHVRILIGLTAVETCVNDVKNRMDADCPQYRVYELSSSANIYIPLQSCRLIPTSIVWLFPQNL